VHLIHGEVLQPLLYEENVEPDANTAPSTYSKPTAHGSSIANISSLEPPKSSTENKLFYIIPPYLPSSTLYAKVRGQLFEFVSQNIHPNRTSLTYACLSWAQICEARKKVCPLPSSVETHSLNLVTYQVGTQTERRADRQSGSQTSR